MAEPSLRCERCYISDRVPNVVVTDGVCNLCREHDASSEDEQRDAARAQMLEVFASVKESSKDIAAYDCIVALSGGKDSSYVLRSVVEDYGLRALAVTVDNGFLSRQSVENSRRVCDHLKTDFVLFRPNFQHMRGLYQAGLNFQNPSKAMIKRASDVCSNCINLINTIMIREALSRNVRLIVGGYISGQVPRNGSVITLHLKTLREFAAIRDKAGTTSPYAARPSDFDRFANTDTISICNPYLAGRYDEAQILSSLHEIGWAKPNDTGAHSSNCRINDLGIVNHQRKYGFHPYELEVTEQVRRGSLTYAQAKAKIDAKIDMERIEMVRAELERGAQ